MSSSSSKHAAAVTALFPETPEVLEFESSWTERNNDKRYMLILFFPQVNQFQILLDDSKVPLTISVENPRTGEPMKAWDLHVGAVIDVLGRSTTLMTCSMSTMIWLDDQARRLWKMKLALEQKLNKFRTKPKSDLSYGLFKKLDSASTSALGGIINVGSIARVVVQLEEELSRYQ
jgi:hypothetical protein